MSRKLSKTVHSLCVADLKSHPVWRFTDAEVDDADETYVEPVTRMPTSDLDGKLVGTRVELANGMLVWALLGNVDARDAYSTEHFLSISVFDNDRWFVLARYHDSDYRRNGPDALARLLGLAVDDVFPISYDIRAYAKGEAAALMGTIRKKPRERLSKAKLMKLAVP